MAIDCASSKRIDHATLKNVTVSPGEMAAASRQADLPAPGERGEAQSAERREYEAWGAVEGIPGLRASPVAGHPDIAASVEHGP